MIETGLRDEGISQGCSMSSAKQSRPQRARPLPVALGDFEQGDLEEEATHRGGQPRIAEQFRQYDGWKHALMLLEGESHNLYVGAAVPAEIRDEGATIERDQRRSWRSALRSTENATLPRSERRRS
jgi:hypothetical protein